MTRFGAVAYLAAIVFALPLEAQPAPNEEELRRHTAYLASDGLEGRRPGSIGEALSADYIARHLAEIGLEPGYAEGYLDHVELVDRRVGTIALDWTHDGETIRIDGEDVLGFGRGEIERLEDRPVVFLGFGRDLGDPDTTPLDLEGAVVLLLADRPGVEQGVDDFEQRQRQLAGHGVAAVIGIVQDEPGWAFAEEMAGRGRAGLAETPMAPVELMLAPSAGARLLRAAGYDFDRLAQRASSADFEPALLPMRLSGEISTGVFPLTGHNVLARLPGSGGGGEAVLYLAHHDHLGLCRPEGAADRICNGAVDNASGVAQLIEIAEGLAAGKPPGRDIYFLATTAEELGLFGARAFVEDPPLPLRQVVAAINLDTVATSPAGSRMTTVGRGMTPIDPVIARVAAALGRTNYEGEELNDFVERQDGKILLDAGVPALMVGGIRGVAFERFLVGPYHTPDDELTEETDLSGAAEDVVFHIALGRALADTEGYRLPPR